MCPISFKRHCFPPETIRHAVWPSVRLTLSFRDVGDLLVERGVDVLKGTGSSNYMLASFEMSGCWRLEAKDCGRARMLETHCGRPGGETDNDQVEGNDVIQDCWEN